MGVVFYVNYYVSLWAMGKTLYVTDMDGTLLAPDSKVSYRSAKIITELSKQGAMITVATARTPATVEPLLCETYTSLPAIVMTGASLWERQSKTYLHPHYIDGATIDRIGLLAVKYGVNMFQYTLNDDGILDVYYQGNMSSKEEDFVNAREQLKYKRFHIGCHYDNSRLTALFFAMGNRERIFSLADELRQSVNCSVSGYVDIFDENIGIIEVFAPNVSKAEAVKALAQEVEAERIVVFGDNLNDIPMMQVADVAVAVGNALPEVKAIAHEIIGDNATDAVAQYIYEDYK